MAPEAEQMTHDEVWDDSALIDSWNAALEEYKRYHSIHRHGGNVKDLLKSDADGDGNRSDTKRTVDEAGYLPGSGPSLPDTEMRGDATNPEQRGGTSNTQHSHPLSAGPALAPAGLLGSIRDESLKSLLMSWYYAGYYTGYYEGKHASQPQRGGEAGEN